LPIASPIAGGIFHHDLQAGQMVEPADHLVMIVDLSTVWVRIDVLERDLVRIAQDQPVTVRFPAAAGSGLVATKVQVKGLALDPKTHQGTVWAELANPASQFLPGMYGQAEFHFPALKPTLVVPEAALVRQGAERFVFVEEGPGQFQRQTVVVGRRQGDLVELVKGQLIPGDRVMTAGSHELATYFGHGDFRLSAAAAENIQLAMDQPKRRPIAAVTTLAGRVEVPADRRAVVSARLGGTLDRILVDRNEDVQAGQVVAEVVGLELQTMQLELLRNHLQLELLEKTLEQLRPLAEQASSGVTRRQLREAEAAASAARQRRDSFLRKLEAVGVSAAQLQQVLTKGQVVRALPVVSPIAGKVVRFQGTLGQAVKTADPLFEVHDLSKPMVRGIVAERQLAGVSLGQPARVRATAAPGWVGEAAVARSGQVFDPADRTLSVWAELRGPPAPVPLLHGMFADLTLVIGPPVDVLSLPREAILREGSRAFVFVRKEDGTFDRRPVQTGRSDDQFVEIVSGVTDKDRVAVSGVAGLQTAFAAIR
jgi:RND family efflux transporter MFP subunit